MKQFITVFTLPLMIYCVGSYAGIYDIGSNDFVPYVATGMSSALIGVTKHPNEKDNLGKTAIFYAVIFNKTRIVKELLDEKADVSIESLTDKEGNFALDVADMETFQLIKTARQNQLKISTEKPISDVKSILRLNADAKIEALKK